MEFNGFPKREVTEPLDYVVPSAGHPEKQSHLALKDDWLY